MSASAAGSAGTAGAAPPMTGPEAVERSLPDVPPRLAAYRATIDNLDAALVHLLVRLWARLQPVPARPLSPSAPPAPPQEPSGARRPTTDEAPAQERQS